MEDLDLKEKLLHEQEHWVSTPHQQDQLVADLFDRNAKVESENKKLRTENDQFRGVMQSLNNARMAFQATQGQSISPPGNPALTITAAEPEP